MLDGLIPVPPNPEAWRASSRAPCCRLGVGQILSEHPRITAEGIRAAIAFAAEVLRADVVYPVEKVARSKSSRTRALAGRLSDGSAVTDTLFCTSPNSTSVLTLAGLRVSEYGIRAAEVLN